MPHPFALAERTPNPDQQIARTGVDTTQPADDEPGSAAWGHWRRALVRHRSSRLLRPPRPHPPRRCPAGAGGRPGDRLQRLPRQPGAAGRLVRAGSIAGRRHAPSTPAAPPTSPPTSSSCEAQVQQLSVVSAGDNIGASPLTVGAVPRRADHRLPERHRACRPRRSATTSSTRATSELLRMQFGGCHPTDGCQFEPTFKGAQVPVPGRERHLHQRPPRAAAVHRSSSPAACRSASSGSPCTTCRPSSRRRRSPA